MKKDFKRKEVKTTKAVIKKKVNGNIENGSCGDESFASFSNGEQFDFGSDQTHDDSEDNFSDTDKPRMSTKRKKQLGNGQNMEEEYERELQEEIEDEPVTKKKRYLLPVKSGGKLIPRVGYVEDKIDDSKDDSKQDQQLKGYGHGEEDEEKEEELEDERVIRDLSRPVSMAEMVAWREKALSKCRFKIGLLSTAILEDPQQHINNLKTLNGMADEERPELAYTVKKLLLVSMAEIFKDIIPSYHIKHQDNQRVKLKRETFKLENFEKTLLKNYRDFLAKVEKYISVFTRKKGDTRVHSPQTIDLAFVALNVMCDILQMHPYFNYSQNIAQLLVHFLNNMRAQVRSIVSKCISQVFKEDKKGDITLFIVRKINHLVKTKTNAVHCEVVSVFLALRIKEVNLDQEKQAELREKKFQTRRQKLLSMSRVERKSSKRLEQLEKELMETKAEENKQVKQKTLTEVIKVVFTIYFRILKNDPTSKLLCSTLEGIAKFAHLINLEFYQDLVLVLSRLMDDASLGLRQRLLCIQTVFMILSGSGESLSIDPTNFYTHLYRNMLFVDSGRTYENVNLLLNALEIVVIKRRKRITHQRLLAFTKRLTTLATQLLHNGSLSCLVLVKVILQLNKSIDILLELDSSVGQGLYMPDLEDPEHCNAASTSVFELTALRRHYHPIVCKMADHLVNNLPTSGQGSLAPEIGKLSSKEIFYDYNPLEMVFKPSVPTPKQANKKKPQPHIWHDSSLEKLTTQAFSHTLDVDFSSLYKEVRRNGVESTKSFMNDT